MIMDFFNSHTHLLHFFMRLVKHWKVGPNTGAEVLTNVLHL